ncbi:MAG: deiodinase-like protein [Candidatus Acidiferrales bacterium]
MGEDGKVVYKGGLGPFDYKPEEVRAWLEAKFPAPVATR